MRKRMGRAFVTLAAGGALLFAAACGGDGGGGSGADNTLVFGTTDSFTGADPATEYSLPWSMILANTGQTLLWVPPGGSEPEPQLAKKCEWEDDVTYTCTLKKGLKFSDGSDLTAEDVKFSMERQVGMAAPTGPSTLFQQRNEKGKLVGGMKSVEAPNASTVTFELVEPDATWPHRLTHAGAAIVPKGEYSATEPRTENFIGAGPYKITKWEPSTQIVLEKNEHYTGPVEMKNERVLIQKYKSESSLKNAVENGTIQVAYRTLTPTMIADIEKDGKQDGVRVVKGQGVGINYLVFNHNKGPFSKKAVRQAAAYLVDREHIATRVYDGTVQPLYTMVPSIYDGSVPALKKKYGAKPDPAAAKRVLQQAGIETPIKVRLHYTPDHYGQTSADMYAALKQQLEANGLFQVKLGNDDWELYGQQYPKGVYQAYQLGWYPDFADPDTYVTPFFSSGNFLGKGQGYSDDRMDKLLAKQRKLPTKPEKRQQVFAEIQRIAAEDLPTLPIWQDQMIAVVRDGVSGVKSTFDAAYTFRMWLVDPSSA